MSTKVAQNVATADFYVKVMIFKIAQKVENIWITFER